MLRTILLSTIVFGLSGCHGHRAATAGDQDGRSHYVRRVNAKSVVVFVHGVFGGATSTWTNTESRAFWPNLLAGDNAFSDSDIYVLGLDSPYIRAASTIDELVEQAHQDLIADEVFSKHNRVILLCHSMGGIVARKMLTRYQPLASEVALMYFFATPTSGAEITRLAAAFTGNPQVGDMSSATADNYVTLVQRDWRAAQFHISSRCAYEMKPTHGILIVDQMSASALCDGPVLPIARDHIGIVKPTDRNDTSYTAFRTAYLESSAADSTIGHPSPVQSPPTEITTAAVTTKVIEVRCGETKDQTVSVPLTSAQHAGYRLTDAVVSIQQPSNLKSKSAEVRDRNGTDVSIHYRLVGLDPDGPDRCATDGQAVLTIAFLLTGPPGIESQTPPTTRINQSTTGDMSPAIAGVSGSVTIIRNAEPARGGPVASVMITSPSSAFSPLSLATNPAMQGLLLDQRTRGDLSPALTAIGGGVVIQDNGQRKSSERHPK